MLRYEIVINEDRDWRIDAEDLEYMEGQIRYVLKYTNNVHDFTLTKVEDDVTK